MKQIAFTASLLALSAALSSLVPAIAGDLHVRPTTINLGPGQSAATLTVTNNGTTPLNAQIRVMQWTQAGNEEKMATTDAIAVSPPMATIGPRAANPCA